MNYKGSIGKRGEELACGYLENAGFTVKERNFHVSHDEIDIIAENDKYIVFVEVKTRAQTAVNMRYGRPCMAVNYTKKQKMLRAANEYLRRFKPGKCPRIDVIEVYMPPIREDSTIDLETIVPLQIKHITNAVHK